VTVVQEAIQERGWIERAYLAADITPVGIDEVGRGCIAGPVVAACVKLDYAKLWALPETTLNLIRDSKTLSTKQRQTQLQVIHGISLGIGIAEATVAEIEEIGIAGATFLAMNRALKILAQTVDMILVDGNQRIKDQPLPQHPVVKGDTSCFATAAASIIAKETRDAYMTQQCKLYPDYGFSTHVGYGTTGHLEAIKQRGICPLHRKTFAPVREWITL